MKQHRLLLMFLWILSFLLILWLVLFRIPTPDGWNKVLFQISGIALLFIVWACAVLMSIRSLIVFILWLFSSIGGLWLAAYGLQPTFGLNVLIFRALCVMIVVIVSTVVLVRIILPVFMTDPSLFEQGQSI